MNIFRKFRDAIRDDKTSDSFEVSRILKRGPHDRPARGTYDATSVRLMGGW